MSHYRLTGVRRRFGRQRALDGVELVVRGGAITAMLGLNGAGKTSLLRALAAVIHPDRGEILLDGERLERGRLDLRRRLMFLPDSPLVYPWFTPLQQIAMVLHLYDAETPERLERAAGHLEALDLLPLTLRPLGALSRGQRYKAALAALLTLDPDIWLLDEPFASGMDPAGLLHFKRCAREAASRGRLVAYSTQLLEVAGGFADTLVVLHEGRVAAEGPAAELAGGGGEKLGELFARLRTEGR